jgi:hypothetical protein
MYERGVVVNGGAGAIAVRFHFPMIGLGDGKSGLGPGIAFTEDNINRLISTERMAPSGAACLDLAWQHRASLLDV